MSDVSHLSKYGAIAWSAWRQALTSRSALLGRVALFAVILVVFSRLWRVAFDSGPTINGNAINLTWYMAVTEWIALAVPMLHLDIEKDVRSGDLASQLPRPCSYLGVQIARGVGAALANLSALVVLGTPFTWALAGGGPHSPWALLAAIPLAAVASTLAVVITASIGLTSFWLTETGPVYWVWQKLLFILGGLILPLSFYPEVMQTIARSLPFAAILNGPASLILMPEPSTFAAAAVRLLIWGALTLVFVRWFYQRALRVVDINGG